MCAVWIYRIAVALSLTATTAEGRKNATAEPVREPICSNPGKSASSFSQVDAALNSSADAYLDEASCPSTRTAGGGTLSVSFECGERLRPGGSPEPGKVQQTWIPVPPVCFHAECPTDQFKYPAGCGKKGRRSVPCVYSASIYFAMNVLDVYVDTEFPPNGTWTGFAIGLGNGDFKQSVSWNYEEHNGGTSSSAAFFFRATSNSAWKSEDGLRLSMHSRYFVPAKPANSTTKADDECFEFVFPTIGNVNQIKFNETELARLGPEAVTRRKFCVRECPLGSAIPEALTTTTSPASSNSASPMKSNAPKPVQLSEALSRVVLVILLVVAYCGR